MTSGLGELEARTCHVSTRSCLRGAAGSPPASAHLGWIQDVFAFLVGCPVKVTVFGRQKKQRVDGEFALKELADCFEPSFSESLDTMRLGK